MTDHDVGIRDQQRLVLSEQFNDVYNHVIDGEVCPDILREELEFLLERLNDAEYFGKGRELNALMHSQPNVPNPTERGDQ